MTDKEYFYLNSGSVREIALHQGDIDCLVPKHVATMLKEKLR